MRIIGILIRSSLPLFLIASFASVLTGLSSTMVIKTIHQAVQSNEFDQQSFILRFVSFWISYGALSFLASYTVALLSKQVIHKLRVDLSAKILNSTFDSIEFNQSKLLPILTEDIKTIAYSIDRLPSVTTGLATVIGILAYMVWYSPILSVSTVILFMLVFLFTKVSLPYVRKYAYQSRDYLNILFEKFEGLIYGIKELSLNKEFKQSYLNDQIVPVSKMQNKYYLKENIVTSITNRSTDMILLLGMGILILLINHFGFVTLTFFGEYLTLVLFTLAPLATAAGFLSSIKRIDASLAHIDKAGIEMDLSQSGEEDIENQNWSSSDSLIKLEKVKHVYYHSEEDQSFEIGPVNLNINKGEMVFLVGGNGSGKTTLAKIILGLYPPGDGEICYRNKLVNERNRAFYRSRFSAVFTDSFVFEELLHIDEKQIEERSEFLIELLELSKKVQIVDGKFTTKRLSDGQKKRLSLIVSILEDKEVYLFDEWAANQDPHFKDIFYNKVLAYLKKQGKTLIVITHDDRYFSLADKIIKLQDGQVKEN